MPNSQSSNVIKRINANGLSYSGNSNMQRGPQPFEVRHKTEYSKKDPSTNDNSSALPPVSRKSQ